ncbi:hypothetical protein LUU34_01056000 [Aix galericulata]|nr:hypothetical protein LUU34_01056000 [Aix galericulata]
MTSYQRYDVIQTGERGGKGGTWRRCHGDARVTRSPRAPPPPPGSGRGADRVTGGAVAAETGPGPGRRHGGREPGYQP